MKRLYKIFQILKNMFGFNKLSDKKFRENWIQRGMDDNEEYASSICRKCGSFRTDPLEGNYKIAKILNRCGICFDK